MIAKKYLKRDYNLDIFRPYDELTGEERTVLLFGDRRRKFYDKGKEYYWEGLNRNVGNVDCSYTPVQYGILSLCD